MCLEGLLVVVLAIGQPPTGPWSPGTRTYLPDGEGVWRNSQTGAPGVEVINDATNDRGFWYRIYINVWQGIASSFLQPMNYGLAYLNAHLEELTPETVGWMGAIVWYLELVNAWLPLSQGVALLAMLYVLRVFWFAYRFVKSWIPLVSGT